MRHYYVLTYVPKNTASTASSARSTSRSSARASASARARATSRSTPRPARRCSTTRRRRWRRWSARRCPMPFRCAPLPLTFPEPGRAGLTPVLVDAADERHHVPAVRDKKTYTSDFVVLVQFKDDQGQVLEKVSQRYRLNGPDRADGPRQARRSAVLSRSGPDPGRSSPPRRSSTTCWPTRRRSASAPTSCRATDEKALRLSSLVAVRKSERVPAAERPDENPLYVGDQLLYPSMGEPFEQGGAQGAAVLLRRLSGARAGHAGPGHAASCRRTASSWPRRRWSCRPPAADGRIAQVSRIPVEALPPGTYELRVSVRQGAATARVELTFRLVP